MQLPEIDIGDAVDTMAIRDNTLGRTAGAYNKRQVAPIRLGGQEKEGSISGSMKDKRSGDFQGLE